MGWFIVLVVLPIVCGLGWLMYRRRNVTDEYRVMKPFDPSDFRGQVQGRGDMGPGFQSGIRKDPGSPPKL